MINIYIEEKRMKQEERRRQHIANQAWMLPRKKQRRPFKNSILSLFNVIRHITFYVK
ncbi:hypothetical protein [Lederbergia citrea]|uniref:Uncharacterized protein n=1 Tax=Lederbergia citrea TaxID=2833581 RepID=A0A942UVT7_9BACI|nr:hypothetical protein [Lederbergia citrea]MBS4224824.1 hypothetical protein [Lederbergia citrea]